MSDGERAAGLAETLVEPNERDAQETLPEPFGQTIAAAATLRGLGLGGDHATLLPTDERAYAIGEEIARGGMGKILSARDRRLHRDVVIKVTRADDSDPRFEREAMITARLQHPSIVRIYEAGILADGRAFYAMERVRGRGLDAVIADATTLRQRLALLPHVIAVADALAYAHSERIVHRDLKPGNVLIGPFGETVVIDWGLAKDLRSTDPELSASLPQADQSMSSLTHVGSVLGTPTHMAPEQARGEPSDERTDVYAIGAMLYHTLTGAAPYTGRTTDEVLELVKKGEYTPIRTREPQLPADLADIVGRAMAVAPGDRFSTAKELAEELRRYASGQLVASHAYSLSRLFKRWLWKHRAIVGIACAALLVVASFGIVTIRAVIRARDEATESASRAQLAATEAERKYDDGVLRQAKAALRRDPSLAAALLQTLSEHGITREAAHALAVDAAASGLAWELRGHADDVEHLVVSHDGKHVATASDDTTLRWWSLDDYSFVVLKGHTGPINELVISGDDAHLASTGTDHDVWLWDTATGTGKRLAGHTNKVREVAFSPDGKRLVSTAEDDTMWMWDVASGTGKQFVKYHHQLRAVLWVGDRIIVGAYDGAIGHFDPDGHGEMKPAVGVEVRRLVMSPDGQYVASADETGAILLWTPDGTLVKKLGAHAGIARDVAFTPDGKHLVSCGGDKVAKVFSIADGTAIDLTGNRAGIKDIDVSPDGKLVAGAGLDGTVRVWPITGGKPREFRGHEFPVKHVAFTPDGRVVSGSEDDRARIWRLAPPDPPPAGVPMRAWLAAHTNVETSGKGAPPPEP